MDTAVILDRYCKNICHATVAVLLGCCVPAFVTNPRVKPGPTAPTITGKALIYVYCDPKLRGNMKLPPFKRKMPIQQWPSGQRITVNGNIILLDDPTTKWESWQRLALQSGRTRYFDPQLGKTQTVEGGKRVYIDSNVILDEELAFRVGYLRYEADAGTTVTLSVEGWDKGVRTIGGPSTCTAPVCLNYILQAFTPSWVLEVPGQWALQYNISNVEAGKTYYVKWFYRGLKPMHEKDGAKDMQQLLNEGTNLPH